MDGNSTRSFFFLSLFIVSLLSLANSICTYAHAYMSCYPLSSPSINLNLEFSPSFSSFLALSLFFLALSIGNVCTKYVKQCNTIELTPPNFFVNGSKNNLCDRIVCICMGDWRSMLNSPLSAATPSNKFHPFCTTDCMGYYSSSI